MTSSGKSCDEPSSSGSFPENDIIKGGLLNFSNKGPNKDATKFFFCLFGQSLTSRPRLQGYASATDANTKKHTPEVTIIGNDIVAVVPTTESNMFLIQCKDKTMWFKAKSNDERQDWIKDISDTLLIDNRLHYHNQSLSGVAEKPLTKLFKVRLHEESQKHFGDSSEMDLVLEKESISINVPNNGNNLAKWNFKDIKKTGYDAEMRYFYVEAGRQAQYGPNIFMFLSDEFMKIQNTVKYIKSARKGTSEGRGNNKSSDSPGSTRTSFTVPDDDGSDYDSIIPPENIRRAWDPRKSIAPPPPPPVNEVKSKAVVRPSSDNSTAFPIAPNPNRNLLESQPVNTEKKTTSKNDVQRAVSSSVAPENTSDAYSVPDKLKNAKIVNDCSSTSFPKFSLQRMTNTLSSSDYETLDSVMAQKETEKRSNSSARALLSSSSITPSKKFLHSRASMCYYDSSKEVVSGTPKERHRNSSDGCQIKHESFEKDDGSVDLYAITDTSSKHDGRPGERTGSSSPSNSRSYSNIKPSPDTSSEDEVEKESKPPVRKVLVPPVRLCDTSNRISHHYENVPKQNKQPILPGTSPSRRQVKTTRSVSEEEGIYENN